MQLFNGFKGAHKFSSIIYVNFSLTVSKHLHCLNFLKSTFPQLMQILLLVPSGISTSPAEKSCISFHIKVNNGWGPVIYMSRLILMCPR